ncbi:MAG: alkaline phosphatase family protein [Thermoanaerobaculales bacterium]|nr:alkaline phosphatase family protein [Thermoanaerobaculales bacterium]
MFDCAEPRIESPIAVKEYDVFKVIRSIGFAALTVGATSSISAAGAPEIRLVLQITVDQLRGDLPGVVMDRLGEGGFRYLYEHGAVYLDAHHRHANTETIVGHTTLATGADPSAHGMIGNVWLDRTTGALVYNIEDPTVGLLTAGADVDDATEIDPTQKTASTEGRSPRAIAVSTFSDELALHTAGRAKVFGVSVKDRGAVSMAGHAGTAYWFSKKAGEFVTSTYYADAYPQWVINWNHRRLPFEHAGTSWQLDRERSTYLFGDADDQPWETDVAGFGRTFPHSFGPADSPYLTTLLTLSPVGDELTLDFAKTLIVSEGLGADAVPDYLSVSFSSTDYVGHVFGPSSLEAEDNLLRLDRTLAGLLAFVDEHVGLEHTLVVLSADHGGPDAPGYLQQLGIPSHYFDPESLDKEPAVVRLKERFGIGGELFKTYFHPYVYLNRDAIADLELDPTQVEWAIAEELMAVDGIAYAVPSSALLHGGIPDAPMVRSVLANFHPARSGDIFVVFEPQVFINDFDGLTVAATHGSPWRYDTYVPIIFAGAGVRAQHIFRRVETVDVAPTLAAAVGTKPPSGATGSVLVEVVSGRGAATAD